MLAHGAVLVLGPRKAAGVAVQAIEDEELGGRRGRLVVPDVLTQVRDASGLVGLEELGAAVALLAGRHGNVATRSQYREQEFRREQRLKLELVEVLPFDSPRGLLLVRRVCLSDVFL